MVLFLSLFELIVILAFIPILLVLYMLGALRVIENIKAMGLL